jgi:hypothetical protein
MDRLKIPTKLAFERVTGFTYLDRSSNFVDQKRENL